MTYPPDPLSRWQPSTEAELREAAADGRLEETHFCDLKAMVKPGPKPNKELARDLVSFAIDGGRLILGVREPETDGDPLICDPIELDGLPERIESVARDIPDPPLQVSCTVIRSDADPSLGWVIVNVPVSGGAPHMVDSVYYGRGDKQRQRLSDAEVLRHHAAREAAAGRIGQVLDDLVARDPVPVEEQSQAHLFLAAEPLAAGQEMALDFVGAEWVGKVTGLLRPASDLALGGGTAGMQFAPDLGSATQPHRRADGVAMTGYNLDAARIPQRRKRDDSIDEDFIEVEFTERGGIRIGMGRFSYLRTDWGDQTQALIDSAAPVLLRRLLHMVGGMSQATGYGGPWAIGVVATNMRGKVPGSLARYEPSLLPPYDRDVFRQAVVTSTLAVTRTPGAVAAQVLGRLLRALNVSHLYEGMLTDPPDLEG